jgi:hypothetical protein
MTGNERIKIAIDNVVAQAARLRPMEDGAHRANQDLGKFDAARCVRSGKDVGEETQKLRDKITKGDADLAALKNSVPRDFHEIANSIPLAEYLKRFMAAKSKIPEAFSVVLNELREMDAIVREYKQSLKIVNDGANLLTKTGFGGLFVESKLPGLPQINMRALANGDANGIMGMLENLAAQLA